MVAFTQQGSQLLQVFGGPWGAVIGAAVSILGALAIGFIKAGGGAKSAAESAEEYKKAIENANAVLLTSNQLQEIRHKAMIEDARTTNEASLATQKNTLEMLENTKAARENLEVALVARSSAAIELRARTGPTTAMGGIDKDIETTKARIAELQSLIAKLNDPKTTFFPQDPKKERDGKTDAERAADELMRIEDAALKAQEAAKNAAQAVVDRLDPVSAVTRKLEEDQAQLLVAMANGIPIIGGYDAAFAKLEKTYQESIDPLHNLNKAQDELRTAVEAEGATIGMSAEQRAVYLAGLEAELHLRQQNVPATQDGAAAYVEEAQALEKLKIEQDRIKDQLEANDNAAKQLVGTLTDGFGEASKSIATTGFNLEALGQIGERVLNSLIDQFIQLAYVNPLENGLGLNKTPAPTLASVGGSLLGMFGGLLGGGTTAAAGAASSASLAASGPMFAFAEGGDFTVGGSGGTDSQRVQFMATPGEQVSVRTPGQVSNDNRRRTSITINLPPSPNSFGYSPYQIAQRTAERAARAIR
jgi:hypothetical protein